MRLPKPVTIDFETHGIERRPAYPPEPIGVSIKYPGTRTRTRYYAFGHATENNCTREEARAALAEAYACGEALLFHNAKFDLDVAETHLGLAPPAWDRVHDTMFLLFLDDPHQTDLSLKPAAARLLGIPPEEQDAVGDWLVANQPVPNVRVSRGRQSEHYFMRYLAYAPGALVGRYANGDVVRTERLFRLLWPRIRDRGMLEAYDRERRLLPHLLAMERRGLPVDLPRLRADVELYRSWQARLDAWLRRRLRVGAEVNLDSGEQLAEALLRVGKADPTRLPLTETGKHQTSKEALRLAVDDKALLSVLVYRSQLGTCLSTFMEPWLATAERSDGLIFTTWHQTKSAPSGGANVGARTGRLSSTPNFQNIPTDFEPLFKHEARGLPRSPWADLPSLPRVRSYLVPFRGHVFIDRDYSQQEPRILAHFDGGALMRKYLENPWIDFHDSAREELARAGKIYERKPVKNTNLGLIYGMGVGTLAERNGMTVDEARALKQAILELYPGLGEMYEDMRARARSGQPIRTWGGREYHCEPAKVVKGRLREFDYKMVNLLIQGSAADCTKEAIIRFCEAKRPSWHLVLNVHDQLTASVPRRELKAAMVALKEAMEGVRFDVPILSEGAVSLTNWDELQPYDKKGVLIYGR